MPDTTPRADRHAKYLRLIERCRDLEPVATAVAHPCDANALRAAVDAANENLIEPILVGPRTRIEAVAAEIGIDVSALRIVETPHSHEAARVAVELVRRGEAEVLMKGSLHSDELLHEVTSPSTGLRTDRRISQVFVMDVPTYPKPLFVTDAAVNIFPTLDDKVDICQNAIELAHDLGIECPKVAILSAIEIVTSKIPSTIEAAALCKMAERGQITGALLDGPLAMDNAIDRDAARAKGLRSPVAGDADILLAPDLEAANMVAKLLAFLANAETAGIVLGARVPIALASRADSVRARVASCAVTVLVAHAKRRRAPEGV